MLSIYFIVTKIASLQKPLQYLQKKVRYEVDFRKNKHQIFDQVGTIIFDGSSEACL